MNKEEFIGVGVKLFGVFLVVLAIIEVPISIANIYEYFLVYDFCQLKGDTPNMTQEALNIINAACSTIPAKVLKSILILIIYSVFGLYFIKSGKLIKSILNG